MLHLVSTLRRRWLWALVVAISTTAPGAVLAQPPVLFTASSIYDAPRQRMLVFGGQDFAKFYQSVWALSLDRNPAWSLLATNGSPPASRFGHVAVYDSRRERMIVFGGEDSVGTYLADTWALSLSTGTWSPLDPQGPVPPARAFFSAIYDSLRDRMVIFGGSTGSDQLADTWCLALSDSVLQWERFERAAGIPGNLLARYGHTAVCDSRRDRMLVFGGFLKSTEVWALSLTDTTWTFLPTSGTTLDGRLGHQAIYDPLEDRMIVFAGFLTPGGTATNDAWAIELAGTPAWAHLELENPPPTRYYHAMVYDRAYHRMVVFGGYPRNDTWGLSLGGADRWSPLTPEIQVSADTLWLPPTTVGDTAAVVLTVTNTGLTPLHADVTPPFGLSLHPAGPIDLDWNQVARDTVLLAASDPTNAMSALALNSNDPVKPRVVVTVVPDVYAIRVAARVLGDSSRARLGAALEVIVTPGPHVRIEGGSLHYRVSGTSIWSSVPLTLLSTDFLATIPATSVTDRGVDYYVSVENSGYAAFEPPAAPASYFTRSVASADSFDAIPRPTSGSDFPTRQSIEVPLLLPGGATFHGGQIYFRQGGAYDYTARPLTLDPLGRPYGTIPDSSVGPRGLEYWVELDTGDTLLRLPRLGQPPRVIRTREQELVEPAEHSGRRYRMLSVPLDFGSSFVRSIESILTDELGGYDPVRWRAYVWDPVSRSNVEFSATTASKFPLGPGRAYWLITRDPHRVNIHPLDGLSTSTATDDTILLQPGWNQIGNPFDFPVDWNSVTRSSSHVKDAVAFDPSTGKYLDAPPEVLQPFEGYFVENDGTAVEAILVPPRAATPAPAPSASVAAARAPAGATGDVWRLRLRASTSSALDDGSEFGVNVSALAGFDALDASEPPEPPGAWVRVAFAHPEWGRRSTLYRRDVRGPETQGETWDVEVRSATAGEPITLDLSELVTSPGLAVRLIDREQGLLMGEGRAGEMAGLRGRIVSKGTNPYRLTIAAGSASYVAGVTQEAASIPTRLALEQNAPNPFRFATRVRFGLPRSEPVTVEVYSLLGQRVASLLDHAALAPGYHSVVWDGTSRGGAPVASGIYLLRLAAGAETLTGRVVLVR